MRGFTALLVLLGISLPLTVHLSENATARIYEERLNKTMECVKDLLNKGKPEIGLPSFNPFTLKDVSIDFNRFGWNFLQGKILLKSFTFHDTAKFTLTHLEGSHVSNPNTLEFRVVTEWPVSSFEGDYDIDMTVMGRTLKGKGNVRETITNYGSDIKFKASVPIKLHEFSIRVFMEGFQFHIDEVILNGDDVTDDINSRANTGVQWLKENQDVADEFVSSIVMQMVNGIDPSKFRAEEIVGEFFKCWDDSSLI